MKKQNLGQIKCIPSQYQLVTALEKIISKSACVCVYVAFKEFSG